MAASHKTKQKSRKRHRIQFQLGKTINNPFSCVCMFVFDSVRNCILLMTFEHTCNITVMAILIFVCTMYIFICSCCDAVIIGTHCIFSSFISIKCHSLLLSHSVRVLLLFVRMIHRREFFFVVEQIYIEMMCENI